MRGQSLSVRPLSFFILSASCNHASAIRRSLSRSVRSSVCSAILESSAAWLRYSSSALRWSDVPDICGPNSGNSHNRLRTLRFRVASAGLSDTTCARGEEAGPDGAADSHRRFFASGLLLRDMEQIRNITGDSDRPRPSNTLKKLEKIHDARETRATRLRQSSPRNTSCGDPDGA